MLACIIATDSPARAQSPPPTRSEFLRTGPLGQKWTGDFDGMVKRRQIRALVAPSKTTFFVDKGTERGIAPDVMKAFQDEVNQKLGAKNLRVHVAFIPVSRDELFGALIAGRGDIAMANLTVTPERREMVDFTDPIFTGVSEIVVTGPASPKINSVNDLAGKDVFVRKSSSHYESLTHLNEQFRVKGKPPITLTPAPEPLRDEDLLEMLNAGLVKILVVDNHTAQFWKQVLPDLTLHPDVAVRTGGDIAWAIRNDSPRLKAELNGFIKTHGARTAFGRELLRQNTKYVKNATTEAEMAKFLSLVEFFRKYGQQYDLDWMLMAAQGYQESQLDNSVRSRVGAIGVMQVMPKTGQELGVGNIAEVEPNIHAGVKYIRFMIDRYYKNEPMDDLNKMLFAFASYNAGAGRIRQLRQDAAKRGLDPNVWFNNVEQVTAEKIGRETVTYVSNIYKYYIAYSLAQGEYLERQAAKRQLAPPRAR